MVNLAGDGTADEQRPATPGPVAPAPVRDDQAFVRHNTRLMTPPLVPEMRLHLAEESLPIWQQTEEQLGALNVAPPYWAFAWAGGQALARHILDHPASVAGKPVLDLGCGSGLAAIAAALAGASAVLAADIDPLALTACRLNAEANGVALQTTASDLLAERPDPALGVVLVGDLFYEKELASRVGRFIVGARDNGALVLVGDPQRSYFPTSLFRMISQHSVPVTRELEDALIKRTAVWRLACSSG